MSEEYLVKILEGVQSLTSNWGYARAGHQGDLLASGLHGPYYEANKRGELYMYHSGAAGITVLKYDNVNPALCVWNKSTTHRLELVELGLAWAGTPAVAGNIGFGLIPAAGTGLGTPITAYTELATVLRMKDLASANPPYGKAATTNTIVALAAAAYIPIISLPDAMAAASTTAPPYDVSHQFRGDFFVPPGAAITVSGNVAQTQVMGVRLSWVEVPV